MALTAAQNLQETFNRAGAAQLQEWAANPTAPTPGAVAVIAQSILAIEKHLVEQASSRRG